MQTARLAVVTARGGGIAGHIGTIFVVALVVAAVLLVLGITGLVRTRDVRRRNRHR